MTRSDAARAAIAFACLSFAIPAVAQMREPVTAKVSYTGLDLGTAAGQAALKARVERVARRTCESMLDGVQGVADRSQCIAEMRRDSDTRIAALIKQHDSQLAIVSDDDKPNH